MDLSVEFVTGIDLVDITLWLFVIFFLGLVVYLQRESAREGYPSRDEMSNRKQPAPFFFRPGKKTFHLPNGRGELSGVFFRPEGDQAERPLKRTTVWAGSPYVPVGNPLLSGVGPASWGEREDVPDLTADGRPRITPYRVNPGYTVAKQSLDPRGRPVIGADGEVAGEIVDLWVDRSESIIRYFETRVETAAGPRNVLVPVPFCNVKRKAGEVHVWALLAHQFAEIPGIKSPDSVTRLEEDKITGYFGGGTFYATPERKEPMI